MTRRPPQPVRSKAGIGTRTIIAALALGFAACAPGDEPLGVDFMPQFDGTAGSGELMLCKYTRDATPQAFDFSVSATGGAVAGDGNFSVTAQQDLIVGADCQVVWTATGEEPETVTITEHVPAEWELFAIHATGVGFIDPLENPVDLTFGPNGGVVFFKNQPGETPPPPPDCSVCEGGLTELTLRNNGPAGYVVVEGKKKDGVIFEGFVEAGETFTLIGTGKKGRLPNEVKIRVDGGPETRIHTSCSQPIGPGMTFGAFEVVEAFSRNGGLVCAVDDDGGDDPICDDLCELGKPAMLTMLLTGDDCSASSHMQDDDKVACEDFGALSGDLRVVVSSKRDPTDNKAETWFDGTVSVGSEFVIDGTGSKKDRLKSNTFVSIYDGDTLVQTVEFHTSCSQPIELDDQYGSLRLTGFTPEA